MTIKQDLIDIAENVSKVYKAGKKAEYDAFWDTCQQNGKRIDYQGAFYGVGWNDTNFKPKYDFKPDNCGSMFLSSKITDLSALLEEHSVKLDTSRCVRMDNMFYYCPNLIKVPPLDCRLVTQSGCFNGTFRTAPKLETIEKLILRDDGSQTFNNAFAMSVGKTNALQNITFEGVIGQNIDFQYSPLLSMASIKNIVEHLSDSTTDKTLTLSRTAVENAFTNNETYTELNLYNGTSEDGGYTLTPNGDNTFTLNGSCNVSYPPQLTICDIYYGEAGTYNVSLENTGDTGFYIWAVTSIDSFRVEPGDDIEFTLDENGFATILLNIDAYGYDSDPSFSNVIIKPHVRKKTTWGDVEITKPNWTISLI